MEFELIPVCTSMQNLEYRATLFKIVKTRRELGELLGFDYNFLDFSTNQYYTEFSIAKGCKKRIIAAPNKKLKSIQKSLADILLFIFQPKECVHAFVKDKNIVSNARPHLRSAHVLRLDLKDFFPSIYSGRVKNLFETMPFYFPRVISTAIAKLCCYKNSLPQGAPTSPIISNMICLKMDEQLTDIARNNNCIYTRYADDITFSTNNKIFNKKILFSKNPLIISNSIINIIQNKLFYAK